MKSDTLISMSFGEMLHMLRTQKKVRQHQLAEKLGVHRNTIGAWERGDRLPDTRGLVLELAKHLYLDDNETRLLLQTSLTCLSSYWSIPYQRNPFFTGRAPLLKTLHERLYSQQTIALSQPHSLSGLGGIGKTQVALEYAYQHALDYHAVFWITSETLDTLYSSFEAIAEQLHLPEHKENDHQQTIQAVLRWLTMHKEWLLIFDNVEEVTTLKPFLPSARQGAILITTRMHSLDGLACTLELPSLPHDEGLLFLLRRAGFFDPTRSPDDVPSELMEPAGKLVAAMDGLPLALDQEGAYIERTGCSLNTYMQLYQSHQTRLLEERSEIADHPHSVVKTFMLSFEKLIQVNPSAADLLRICAFLAPDAIPEELFLQGATASGGSFVATSFDPYIFNQTLGDALHYSLLYRQPQSQTFSLHRLVQFVLRSSMDATATHQYLSHLVKMLSATVSFVQEKHSMSFDDRYVPHVRSILEHIQQRGEWKEQATLIPLWYYIGFIAEQYSQLVEARDAYLKGLAIAQSSHHPFEGRLLAHLGSVMSDLGNNEQALLYVEQGADRARQYSDDDALCLARRIQGEIQDNSDNYQRAERLY